jgi:hypothetical protein
MNYRGMVGGKACIIGYRIESIHREETLTMSRNKKNLILVTESLLVGFQSAVKKQIYKCATPFEIWLTPFE